MTIDRNLQEQVLAALDFEPMDASAIGVSVTHGVVTLRGTVPTAEQRFAAERLAQSVPGVRAVANDLDVPDVATLVPDDPLIAEAAANALTWYRAVPRDAVRVTVRDGWVTLDGTVSQLAERGAAERAVRRLRGIRGISNAITVSNNLSHLGAGSHDHSSHSRSDGFWRGRHRGVVVRARARERAGR